MEASVEVADLARGAKALFVAAVLACFYSWVTIGSISDIDLLTNSNSAKLPLLAVDIPTDSFYYVGPMIVLALYIYLHLHLQRLWERLATLPVLFPDGMRLDEKAYPSIFIGFARHHLPGLRDRRPAFSKLQFALCALLAYALPPFTLYLFWGGYITKQDALWSSIHDILVAISAYFAMRFYYVARQTLRREPTRRRVLFSTLTITSFLFLLLSFLSAASMFGVRSGPPSDITVEGGAWQNYFVVPTASHRNPVYWVPELLSYSLIASFADFHRNDVSVKPPNWTYDTNQIALVKGANLRHNSLRWVNAYRCFLVNADLRDADIECGIFTQSDLRYAIFDRSFLSGASFTEAGMQGTHFDRTTLHLARLQGADLRDASICFSGCDSADLSSANLENAYLFEVSLSKAICIKTDFRNASLLSSDVSGANFEWADLRGANLAGLTGWSNLSSVFQANICGVTNAPDGFCAWATNKMGAFSVSTDEEWAKLCVPIGITNLVIPPH